MTQSERLPRKLAAILYGDVTGYSRLTGVDEDATHRRLSEYLDLFALTVQRHGGRVMHYAGDAVLAKFDAVVDALACAVDVQGELARRNQDLPADRRVEFGIGVNLGDVIEDRGDIYGDGVNVAARLEGLAGPGEICVSDAVRVAVGKRLPLGFVDLGEQTLKNIDHPVRVYRTGAAAETPSDETAGSDHDRSSVTPSPRQSRRFSSRKVPYTLAVTLALGLGLAISLQYGSRFAGDSVARPSESAGSRPDPELRPTVWSGEKGGQVGPVWSFDGRATVYAAARNRGEPSQLYIRELGSPTPRSISRLLDFPVPVQWTREGKILFVDLSGLWSVSPIGTQPERLRAFDWPAFPTLDLTRSVDVLRDASLFAYTGQAADGRVGVFTVALPDGEPAWYSPDLFVAPNRLSGDAPFLRFSPDGKQLLLWFNAGRGAEEAWLLPIPPDAANPPHRVLEDLPVTFGTPEFSWMPDSRHVVVSAGPVRRQAGPRELLLADTRSGRFKLLLSDTSGAKRQPVVSPSGDAFVYTDLQANFDVVTFDLRTGRVTPVIDSLRWEHMPAWAAAAPRETLAYITAPNNAPEVWLHQPGEPDQPLATARDFPSSETTFFTTPALSPDGKFVIYRRVEGPNAKSSNLWISAVAGGGTPERLTDAAAWETGGSWSPDGNWFVYFVQEEGLNVLKKVRTTGQATPETLLAGERDAEPLDWLPVWSPNGEWILVPERGILVAADGSMMRRDLGGPAPCAFAPTEPELYCIQPPSDGQFLVVVRDFEGRVGRTLGLLTSETLPRAALMPPRHRLSPMPDGTGLTYSVGSTRQDLWLMEGLADISLP
jgi:class 3 adenylate cyclase/Tol biopolymer transport system component